jgi:hypothetical protein
MARRFKRAAAVTLTANGESVVIRDLRMRFEVVKTLEAEPNSCKITINNLAEPTRTFLEQKPVSVRLDVGYEDSPLQRLFIGDITWAPSYRARAGWETVIEAGDGQAKYKYARVSRSFRQGTRARDAIEELARALDVTVPRNLPAGTEREFLAGAVLDGSAAKQMTRVLARAGLEWSIQDGQLQILEPTGVRAGEALLISSDTGMIGVPELSSPAEAGKPPTLSVRTLLEPDATPGARIVLQSRSLSGHFKVLRALGTGDTHGTEWETNIEAVPT